MAKYKCKKAQITNLRNEESDIIVDAATDYVKKRYFKQLGRKFENSIELYNSQKTKQIQEEVEKLHRMGHLPIKKTADPESFTDKFYLVFKEIISVIHKLLQRTEKY